MTVKRQLLRRITNNIRMLEHATCLAGGAVIGLEDDLPKAFAQLDIDNPVEDELCALRESADLFSIQSEELHDRLNELAAEHDIDIPTTRVVNSGGGTKGP